MIELRWLDVKFSTVKDLPEIVVGEHHDPDD